MCCQVGTTDNSTYNVMSLYFLHMSSPPNIEPKVTWLLLLVRGGGLGTRLSLRGAFTCWHSSRFPCVSWKTFGPVTGRTACLVYHLVLGWRNFVGRSMPLIDVCTKAVAKCTNPTGKNDNVISLHVPCRTNFTGRWIELRCRKNISLKLLLL